MSNEIPGLPETSERARCPRRYELVRVFVGEASAAEAGAVSRHVASCKRCQAVFQSLSKQRDDFIERHPFDGRLAHLFQTASSRYQRRQLIFRLAPLASVACLLVIGIFMLVGEDSRPTILTKGGEPGGVSLGFYVQRDQGALLAESGELLHENDRIQFTYKAGSHGYLFLVSLDEKGRVSNFNYQASMKSLPVVPGSNRLLEGSIILDDSLGLERIFGVFSDTPLSWNQVESAAIEAYRDAKQRGVSVREIHELPLPYSQAAVLMLKQ